MQFDVITSKIFMKNLHNELTIKMISTALRIIVKNKEID